MRQGVAPPPLACSVTHEAQTRSDFGVMLTSCSSCRTDPPMKEEASHERLRRDRPMPPDLGLQV